MGDPTIFEKMIFWGKYGLDQGSEAVLWQWGLNHSQSERNKPRKTTFLFPSFPFKQMGHPTFFVKSDISG